MFMNLLGPWSELNLPQMRRILSRHQGTPTEAIGIWVLWRNAEGGLKDKQMGDFILIMGLTLRKKVVHYYYINVIRMLRFYEIIVCMKKRGGSGSPTAGIHMEGKQLPIYFFS